MHTDLVNPKSYQWNPVNPFTWTNGPQKSGCVNGVAVLKGFLHKNTK